MLFCSEFDEMLRIRREVDKKIGEITSAVQVCFQTIKSLKVKKIYKEHIKRC